MKLQADESLVSFLQGHGDLQKIPEKLEKMWKINQSPLSVANYNREKGVNGVGTWGLSELRVAKTGLNWKPNDASQIGFLVLLMFGTKKQSTVGKAGQTFPSPSSLVITLMQIRADLYPLLACSTRAR
ncbi:hypothetical protein FOPG_11938 [Fusarium oxysporum f. sp. conglutinans race 2 54008]|uniref:Uncharacterized protein n=1 Tax=Fusarium oxysporum f. sp. conglutinans race 2 54008 TaxID=1089457 RepID=X0HLM2_FUSOX|nr:hypothetical protein FOPG_11938 [Fusarium oxysporum f. sp. conglutinans race 2 54008]KAI8403014.1 hypothetical protein FOFC_16445 [Fusarium oxysporum]